MACERHARRPGPLARDFLEAHPMELYQARYFINLAKTLNFTRAAEACNVTQPALTRAVQRLEEEFGGPLLHRERNLTQLTELGRQLLPLIEQTYNAAESAKALALGFRQRTDAPLRLGIGCTISAELVAPILGELQQRIAGFELGLSQAGSDSLLRQLLDGTIDAAIVVEPERIPERINRWPLFAERYVLACPAGHRLAALDAVPLAALADESLILRDGEGADCEAWLQRRCAAQGIALQRRHAVAGEDRLVQMVAAGLGVALTGERQPAPAGTVARPLGDDSASRCIMLGAVAGRQQGPAVTAFVKLVRARDWSRPNLPRPNPAIRPAHTASKP
jgi:DNA-binding transcriptional LysR family regulator